MKTPALLMLSALVAMGHWLLLAPGPDMLARLTSIGPTAPALQPAQASAALTGSTANAATRVMQTRRIDSPARVLTAVSVAAPQTRRPARAVSQDKPKLPAATQARPEPAMTTAAPEPSVPPDAVLNPVEQSAREKNEASAATPAEPAEAMGGSPAQLGLASLVAPAVAPPPAAQLITHLALPKAARLNYDITGQSRGLGYRASGLLDWQQDGKHYDARMVASVFFLGSRTLTSQGEVTADGLAPTRFADKARAEQAAHFQPDKGKITFSANTPDAPWQRGAQDRLSVFFQLSGMLAGQPERLTPGTHIPIYTAGARGADIWAFLVDGPENLKLPAGDMATLKLSRQSRMDYDQTVEIWFAPALSYWPVRIKVTQRNGDFVDQQLASTATP